MRYFASGPHFQRLAIVFILVLISLSLPTVSANADEDIGDNYWLKQLHIHLYVAPTPAVEASIDIAPARVTSTPIPIPIPIPTVRVPVALPAPAVPSGIPNWIPSLTPAAHALLRRSVATGHDPRLFTIAGDSNSNPGRYLARVINGAFHFSEYPELKRVADYYAPSFTRISIASGGGFRAADMFDISHNARLDSCHNEEGLFACELRMSNASIVFIQLGTGDKFVWRDFEHNYRAMIDYAIAKSVLPVLVTKADDIESLQGGAGFGYINAVIRSLAAEYQVPLVDMYAATRDLPVIPNPDLPKRPFTQFGLQDEWGYYYHLNDIGQDRHILITLQTLASIGS